ncbi:MAG: serine/threonine protein kinase [Treponema sp.]|jgi:serine/threonine-protein kinase|nr:serine/threonine protein kinase [Treponema sp.]
MEELPEKIGKYKVHSLIARGGMGAVYKAVHPTLKREVVIKKLTLRGNASVRERFKREAKILLDLKNDHIVHMFDYFTEGSSHYIVLEFVDGMSLDVLLKKKSHFSNEMALLILHDACLGLKYAHDHGIVHRDIKPGNILISKKGAIKLADFGIAASGDEEESALTQAGMALGTPAYMPPEQFSDSKTVDKRADIYALGIMLYEMVTGAKPFPGTFSAETITSIQKGKYTSPKKINSGISPAVCNLIRKMIRPDPSKRFQSTDNILRSVRRYLKRYTLKDIRIAMVRNIITSKIDEPEYVPHKPVVLFASIISAAVILLCAGGFAAWKNGIIQGTVLRSVYTPVSVSMSVPSAAFMPDMPFRAFFFENDGDIIPEVKNGIRVFSPVKNEDEQNGFVYQTKNMFLKPGSYRVKVVAGPRIWWNSFTVTEEEQTIALDFGQITQRDLTFNVTTHDALTGADITEQTEITAEYRGRWLPVSEIPEDFFRTNTIIKIRASSPDYVSEIFSLKIDWYQDELYIAASLKPEE